MKNNILEVESHTVAHHKLASEHREMNNAEFEALKLDIEQNGQLIPVILYKGKLVDGRHRQRALIELGIHDMKAISLPGNMSLNDVRNKVIGTEMRRNDNVMQKSIRALKWMNEESGRTQSDAAIKFGIDQSYVSQAKKLLDMLGSNILDKMYKNGYLMIDGKKIRTMKTIIKIMSKIRENEPSPQEPISEPVKSTFEILHSLFETGDMVSISQIESYAKKLRMKEV